MIPHKVTYLALLCILIFAFSAQAQTPKLDAKEFKANTTRTRPLEPHGFFKSYGTGFGISMSICAAGAVADIASSSGQESNPILRNSRGGLNVGRAVVLKVVACGWPTLIERRHPRWAFWARTTIGIAFSLGAWHNE